MVELTQPARGAPGRASERRRRPSTRPLGQILDLIRMRGLGVGDVLPTERELCDLFGASRNTVREALRTIRTYGLIEPGRASAPC